MPRNKWTPWMGFVLTLLVGGMMLMGGVMKVLPNPAPDMVAGITKYGLQNQIQLIGSGELVSAVLLILPWTSPLGTLLTSGFFGGAICLHMSHGESYVVQSALLLVVWAGASLRGSVPLFHLGLFGIPRKNLPPKAGPGGVTS